MKKGVWVSIIAGVAAVAAAAVAITAYLKKKSQILSDQLDYDPDEYFDVDAEEIDPPCEEGCCCECEDGCSCGCEDGECVEEVSVTDEEIFDTVEEAPGEDEIEK